MYKLFSLVLSLFLFLICISKIHFCCPQFSVSLQATYSIPDQGAPLVRNELRIKNNISTIFSTQYALEVGSTSLRSIRAYDQQNKNIQFKPHAQTRKQVSLTFPDKIIGRDKERVFTIEYEHPDAALITGNVLEIDVPKVTQQDAFQQYSVIIEVPAKYKTPAAAAPATFVSTSKTINKSSRSHKVHNMELTCCLEINNITHLNLNTICKIHQFHREYHKLLYHPILRIKNLCMHRYSQNHQKSKQI